MNLIGGTFELSCLLVFFKLCVLFFYDKCCTPYTGRIRSAWEDGKGLSCMQRVSERVKVQFLLLYIIIMAAADILISFCWMTVDYWVTWKQDLIRCYQCNVLLYNVYLPQCYAPQYLLILVLKFPSFSLCFLLLLFPVEQTALQIQPGIDGLKDHKTRLDADAGYCDKSFSFKYLIARETLELIEYNVSQT